MPLLASAARLAGMRKLNRAFWQRHPGLIWSNPDAGDSAYLCAALLQPRFDRLLDVALEFGVIRLRQEWRSLLAENTPEVRRARPAVERILRHIEEGFRLAVARN